jgi:predicted signal transduction protein with EAL and GGDEF domain
LRAITREIDTVARLGADEFAIIQPFVVAPDSARAFAERIVSVLAEPFDIDGTPVSVDVCIGIASHPSDATHGEALLSCAELALERAKRAAADGICFFEPETDSRLRARRLLDEDLRRALARREMEVVYQPVFGGEPLVVVGYEALLRWHHPVRGLVPPAEFIPLAESSGEIGALGQWVLETACREAVRWDAPYRVSVNLSPAQFAERDLPGRVARVLSQSGLPPQRLEIEVTEGLLIEDTDRALAILLALKAQGVRIALDDFGTGYASLSYLRRFPFDRIKIDRSFIAELGVDPGADAIVRSIMALTRSLQLDVTAEGVETETQLALLRAQRCGQLQGFLLGRPVSAGEIQKLPRQGLRTA